MCRAAENTGLDEESRLKGEGLHEGGFLPTCPHLTWQVLSEAGGRGAGAFLQVSKTHPLSHSTPASLLACCFHYSHSHEVWCAVLQFAEHGSSSLFSPQGLFSPGTGNQPKPQKALIHERKSTSLPGQWEAGDPRDSGSLGSGARGEGVCVCVSVCACTLTERAGDKSCHSSVPAVSGVPGHSPAHAQPTLPFAPLPTSLRCQIQALTPWLPTSAPALDAQSSGCWGMCHEGRLRRPRFSWWFCLCICLRFCYCRETQS